MRDRGQHGDKLFTSLGVIHALSLSPVRQNLHVTDPPVNQVTEIILGPGLLASRQRRAMMASAPSVVQCMPDCLRRWPMTDLQSASTTPEPVNRPHWRNHL